MSESKKIYCHSVDDGETFYGSIHGDGTAYSREDALKEAVARLMDFDELPEAGNEIVVWTAEQVPAVELFRKMAKGSRLGEQLFESICDYLYDELGEAVDNVTVPDINAFSADLCAVVEKHVKFDCFSVENAQKLHYVVTAEDVAV